MTTKAIRRDDIWFRNPMVWLMISIPALTIVGCLVTIFIALSNPDFIVSDEISTDYPEASEQS